MRRGHLAAGPWVPLAVEEEHSATGPGQERRRKQSWLGAKCLNNPICCLCWALSLWVEFLTVSWLWMGWPSQLQLLLLL